MDADQNLSFGVLALQADFIDAMQFADACKEWGTRKDVSLAQLLVERGWLTAAQRSELEQRQRPPLRRQQESVSGGLATVTDPAPGVASTESCAGSGLETPPLVPFVSPARARYTLARLHAAGGIGRVWLAHDDHLGRDVALKELRPDMAESRAHRQRFVQEARVTGQLEHPSIVPVYELTEQPGNRQPFYVMRFVQGRTFSEAAAAYHEKRRAGQASSLELAALLNAFVGVCNAVAYAHVRGVIHRDLKGQNIVLGEFGEVIVLDWGLAKVLGQAEATASPAVLEPGDAEMRTAQGQVLGTPAYLAPEQAAGQIDRIDQRTDVYGLGAILYEILTGRPPFTGSDVLELLRRVREQEPVRPRALWAEVPRALEAVCLRALAKEPEQRYASAQEMAEEVRRWLADEPVQAYRESLTARLARWARRHKTWVSGAAALLVTVALALAVGVVLVGEQKARAEANFQKAEEQRAMAEENFRLAHDAVDRYFVQVSESKLLNVPGL